MTFAKAQTIDQQTIPVIDLSDITSSTSASVSSSVATEALEAVGRSIHSAANEFGFFYVSGHGIDSAHIEDALAVTRTFFELHEDQKSSVTVNQQQRGWMRSGMANLEGAKTHDLKEVFFYGRDIDASDPDLQSQLPLVALNQWPDSEFPALRETIITYQESMCTVGELLLAAIAVGFGLHRDFFKTYYERPLARGQLVYYPASTESDEVEGRYGVAPHTDFGVLTLLYQDDSGGLQVKSGVDGWIEAPPIPGTLVCNTGDLLERWTAGLFPSTVHRVINRSRGARYSMPVFFDPNSKAPIDPLALGLEPSDTYPPVLAGEHIASRNRRNFKQYK